MDVREKIAAEVLPATWSSLVPHARRNALFIVDAATDLVDAGVAVATDDQEKVSQWIRESTLRRPSAAEIASWDAHPVAFLAVIVQPFVLCRPIALPGPEVRA